MSDISLVSHSTTIRGNISGSGSLHVEGRVRGDISVTGDVILGPQAQVAGNITGATVSVDGAVEGDVNASVALSVGSNAKVVGDLTAPNIGIEEGALVRGRIETDGAGAPATPVRSRAAAGALGRAPIGRRPELGRTDTLTSRDTTSRFVAPRVAAPAPRREAPLPPKAVPATKTVSAPIASATTFESEQLELSPEVKAKKQPPPPVVMAPRKGAKGRKKAAKRE
jgi:cytoskeletal protein CcmA (bactofilin family)